jgi:hypothetical protein
LGSKGPSRRPRFSIVIPFRVEWYFVLGLCAVTLNHAASRLPIIRFDMRLRSK